MQLAKNHFKLLFNLTWCHFKNVTQIHVEKLCNSKTKTSIPLIWKYILHSNFSNFSSKCQLKQPLKPNYSRYLFFFFSLKKGHFPAFIVPVVFSTLHGLKIEICIFWNLTYTEQIMWRWWQRLRALGWNFFRLITLK